MPILAYSAEPAVLSIEDEIAALALRLANRAHRHGDHGDAYSWEQASDYVETRACLQARSNGVLTSKSINKRIRSQPGYAGPGPTFLSHAWALYEFKGEVFGLNQKSLPYQQARLIAISSLRDRRAALWDWAVATRPTQQELRDRIRELTGDDRIRRGFRLAVTNHWKFASTDGFDADTFDGGISADVIANLVHYFTDPGDLVVDPMAGSGRLGRVLATCPYFQPDWVNKDDTEFGGPRVAAMSDIAPAAQNIAEADARLGIPFHGAGLVILDPPYWRIAKGKYQHGGDDLEDWSKLLIDILRNCRTALRPDGWLAFVLDDYLRSRQWQPLALFGARLAESAGFIPRTTIYNAYTNATDGGLDRLGQWRAKRARLMVSGMKIINMFSVSQQCPAP